MTKIIDYIASNWQSWVGILTINLTVLAPVLTVAFRLLVSKKNRDIQLVQDSQMQSVLALLELLCEQQQLLLESQNAVIEIHGSATLKQRYKDTVNRINKVYATYQKLQATLQAPIADVAKKAKDIIDTAKEILNVDTNQIVIR